MKKIGLTLLSLNLLLSRPAYTMHISDGYLTPRDSIMWWIIYIIFFIIGVRKISKIKRDLNKKLLLALVGAFVFFISAIKIPTVTGSSSHATGIALGAILLGVGEMYVIGGIVLLFQAILLAHGGLTTLGANGIAMGAVGAIIASAIYKFFKRYGKEKVGIFLAAFIGNLSTYTFTAFELALSHSSGDILHTFIKFLSLFMLTQIPLGIVEGILTLMIIKILEKEGFFKEEGETV